MKRLILLIFLSIFVNERTDANDVIDETVLYCPNLFGFFNYFKMGSFLIIDNKNMQIISVFDDDLKTEAKVLNLYDVIKITAKEVIITKSKEDAGYVEEHPVIWSDINRETLVFMARGWLDGKTTENKFQCELSSISEAQKKITALSDQRDKERNELRDKNKF